MDEQTAVQPPSGDTAMSFSDKLMNIFASPSTLFEDVARGAKNNSNWVLPLIVTILVSIVFSFVVFSQPPIKAQLQEQQVRALQQRVDEGKMTQEQFDQVRERMPEPGSPFFMISASVGVLLFMVVALFVSALMLWLAGKALLKTPATYMKVVEVVGLAMYIMAFGTIISMIIMVAAGSLYATPSLGLFVSSFDPVNKVHKLLSSFNIFTFWYLGIISIGLSRVFPSSLGKAVGIVAVLWAVWTVITLFAGIGGM